MWVTEERAEKIVNPRSDNTLDSLDKQVKILAHENRELQERYDELKVSCKVAGDLSMKASQ